MKKIAVVMGGYSAEKIISMKSGEVVMKHLQCDEFHPYSVVIDKNDWNLIENGQSHPINKEDFSVNLNGVNKILTSIELKLNLNRVKIFLLLV